MLYLQRCPLGLHVFYIPSQKSHHLQNVLSEHTSVLSLVPIFLARLTVPLARILCHFFWSVPLSLGIGPRLILVSCYLGVVFQDFYDVTSPIIRSLPSFPSSCIRLFHFCALLSPFASLTLSSPLQSPLLSVFFSVTQDFTVLFL